MFADRSAPSPEGLYPIAVALRSEAAAELVTRRVCQLAAEQGLDRLTLADTRATGLASVTFQPDWAAMVLELRPAPRRGEASLDLLASVPGTAEAAAGPLAMEQAIRLAVRLPVELGARVLDGGGLELVATLSSPDGVQLSVQLPGFPPGSGAVVSGTAQSALREHVRAAPPESWVLAEFDQLGPSPDLVPLREVSVFAFPDGLPVLFVGVHTALPVLGGGGIGPGDLLPVDEDWLLRVDQQTLTLILARAALAGRLGNGVIPAPDRLDVTHVHLDGTGFQADLRVWRFRPPPGILELSAVGRVSWEGEGLSLTVESLEMYGQGEIARKRTPWTLQLDALELPWPLERLDTVDGALVAAGRIPDEPSAGGE